MPDAWEALLFQSERDDVTITHRPIVGALIAMETSEIDVQVLVTMVTVAGNHGNQSSYFDEGMSQSCKLHCIKVTKLL